MALEANAEKIERLALVPVRRRPDGNHRRHYGFCARQPHAKPQPLLAIERKKMIVQLKARLDRKAIHRGKIGKKREEQIGLAGEIFRDRYEALSRDNDGCFTSEINYFGDGLWVPVPEPLHYRVSPCLL